MVERILAGVAKKITDNVNMSAWSGQNAAIKCGRSSFAASVTVCKFPRGKKVDNLEILVPTRPASGLYVAGKGECDEGETVLFVPNGAVVDTEKPWFHWLVDKFHCGRFYKVGTKKFHGIVSQGIVVVLSKLPKSVRGADNCSKIPSEEFESELGISRTIPVTDACVRGNGSEVGDGGGKQMNIVGTEFRFTKKEDFTGRYVVVGVGSDKPPTRTFDDRPSAIKVAYSCARRYPDTTFLVCKIVGYTSTGVRFNGEEA